MQGLLLFDHLTIEGLSNNSETMAATAAKTSHKKWIWAVSNFFALIPSLLICGMLLIYFQELNSEGLYLSSQKEKGSRCLVITSSIKREIRKFHAVDGSDDHEMYGTKAWCTCKLVFWQSKPIIFLPFSLSSLSTLLKLTNNSMQPNTYFKC